MAQKTNLNVSPYFDDFFEDGVGARDKNYYKLLFNPGKPIQARELNTLQSILQNQIETFGSHIFQDGSMVIPGNIVFDNQFYAVKLNNNQYGLDIQQYIEQYVGKQITGQSSGVSATVRYVQIINSEVENVTLYVKYNNSDTNFEINPFSDNELLYSTESISFGSSGNVITAGTPFASTISSNSTEIGSAASIGEGVYFIRGTFVRVPKQTIILDYYTNTPSYRVGLSITEEIITPNDDSSLYDNARGFTNYAAPGADRFKITLTLSKKLLTDNNDIDFVELLRTKSGGIQKVENKTSYSLIRDYLAQRTYDESGNYSVTPFQISINDSVNNRIGNDGLFFDTEKTNQGNTPTDDLMCLKISPGKAYVKGYDIEKAGVEIIDVDKPRTTENVSSVNIPFQMGNLLRINNVTGSPKQKEVVYLQNRRKDSTTVSAGTTIGSARVYNVTVTDAAYSNAATSWDLYLYDVQTYTELTLNQTVSSVDLPTTSFIKGISSGASGYAVSAGNNSNIITINQTSGSFSVGEKILINGVEVPSRTISAIKIYGVDDIKSVHQPTSISGFNIPFLSDTQLNRISRQETITISAGSGGISTATVSSPASFTGIKTDSIIRYQRAGISTEVYNRIVSISPGLNSITLESVSNVPGVCNGDLPNSQYSGNYSIGSPTIQNENEGFLYAQLPDSNVSSVNLSNSTITFSAQTNASFTPAVTSNTLTVNTGNFNLGINSISAKFEAFDEERYSIFYNDGTIENLTSDKVSISLDSSQVTFSQIQNRTISAINATLVKNNIQSKIKQFNRSNTINIIYSKNSQSGVGINTSINDGLIYNKYYGLRVQDEEISLNYPDVIRVIAVYESLDTNNPTLDTLTFSSIVNVTDNAIIGENIIGSTTNTVVRVVSKPSANTLGIIYLNDNRFLENENVSFEESNIITAIESFTRGKYRDVSSKFILENGQKEQYYDYSKIIRRSGESSPSRRLLVVFDHYSVPSDDTGDVYTVNSYAQERFSTDIPNIGRSNIRCSDVLDFRPRVSIFTGSNSSPFDFSSRAFANEPKIIMSPNESALVGYDFYLARIDKLVLDKSGAFVVLQGTPALDPKAPNTVGDVMEIASINLPPYLYSTKSASISLVDNRRYTMRDIGKIEDRVENLERVTSLSLLELNTQTLQIQDAQGLNRFKTGFFVDDFKNTSLINFRVSTVEVDPANSELRPLRPSNSINLRPVSSENTSDESIDLNTNFSLFDSNVQKSGDAITLKYESIGWINQSFATKVENVNPFNVVSYSGTIKLSPENDSWVRTIRLQDVIINRTEVEFVQRPAQRWFFPFWFFGGRGNLFALVRRVAPLPFILQPDRVNTTVQEEFVGSGSEIYMRSRNTGFTAVNLKPLTRFYQFLDGNSGVDFIPKLIEISSDSTLQNYGATRAFLVGETVDGWMTVESGSTGQVSGPLMSFRVAYPNHKEGSFNNPSLKYTLNPYVSSESIPESYSASSKVLNIDINSLCEESQGLYRGYLRKGMRLVGRTSGAVAYVKDLRLITDVNGVLSGSFFLRNPLVIPPPPVRISTGSKVYKLTSSSTNETPLPGSKLISSAETIYRSEGTWEQRRNIITNTRITQVLFYDPLAQSFTVAGTTEADNGNVPDEDSSGVYLTSVDIFFASKDSNNAPVTVEVRTMELGTPTRNVLGKSVTLNPSEIQTSSNASIATKFTFEYPVYLEPNLEYCIVVLAPQSDQYEVWIAEMGEKTIETSNLPDSQAVKYSRQFATGSLFKSQNGSIWTANQYQDMKFKLYKAKFTSKSGSVLFHNPTLNESNNYIPTLQPNPITIFPKRVTVGISTIFDSNTIGILTEGRKISSASNPNNYGYIVGTGSSVSSVAVTNGGVNYKVTNNVSTYNITGKGSGLRLNITSVSVGSSSISALTIANPGNGYANGDVVGITTADVSPAGGNNSVITISGISTGVDTLYLSKFQGETFNVGINSLTYYDGSGNPISIVGTNILSSTNEGGVYSGNFFKVDSFQHGMYSNTNKVQIYNIESDIPPTLLANSVLSSSQTISVASTSNFDIFEGKVVDSTNRGYLKIDGEIIEYTGVGAGTIQGLTRGFDSTQVSDHNIGSLVYKFELGGVSLRRINKTHNINSQNIDIDSYNIEFDRSVNGLDRSTDTSTAGYPELSFNDELSCGGIDVRASQNIQFENIIPHISLLNPGSFTSVSSQIRTVSGTSVSGSETPFIDQGYESVELGVENRLLSTRVVCSKVNEQQYLNSLLKNKSFTLKLDLASSNTNLSPMVFWKECSAEFLTSRINSPIKNYASDGRVNSVFDDPHSAVYFSNLVSLAQPATSLKVILSAYRHSSADFRVLYALVRPDSSEVVPTFELFPGYNNLTIDNNQDGFLDVINSANNNGLPDVIVPDSFENQFLEYEFSANNLGSFSGYIIKIVMSGTNQSYPPRFRDLRSIALA